MASVGTDVTILDIQKQKLNGESMTACSRLLIWDRKFKSPCQLMLVQLVALINQAEFLDVNVSSFSADGPWV